MDKRELQELLSQSYKQENWKKIVQFVFPNVSIYSIPKEHPIKQKDEDILKSFKELGTVRLNDGKNLALFEVLLNDKPNLKINRVRLNEVVSSYIDQQQAHGVLSVFEQGGDDFRFTFSAKSTEFNIEEGDFVNNETDKKRYTYVLGKNESCKTPAERFFKLSEKKSEVDINAIQNAFSVEQLSKEFFEKYKKQFEKFWKYIHTNEGYNNISFGTDREKGIRDFTKKLLGRIVFLHFLQKKGWMGCTAGIKEWEDGDKQFMQTLFENYSNQSKFHSKCLAELFYNTLNKRRTDDLFVCDGLEGVLSKSKVPYLNGGLFDSDEDITRKIDFPASYFQELFEFFGQYNFTIDENDPNDHEVGIDPEMLGHIFENLLEDNKDKGAFYTPKVIVQYMCQESIIEYINTKINENESPEIKSAIEDLIRNKLAEKCSDLDLVQPISRALFEVKVCDPAIGSGAFPMGILNVIYSAIEELYFIQPDSVASIWEVSDIEWQPHLVKKNIIQHSIYGVDLESGAVDIARLRFWLALVVDEIEPLPLPNLDYKIMQGNSLLESFEGIDLSQISDASAYEEIYDKTKQIDIFSGEAKKSVSISMSFEDIESLMDEYFNANDPETKKTIHKKIDDQVLNHIRFTLLQHKQSLIAKKTPLERKLKLDIVSAVNSQQIEKIKTTSKTAKELSKINAELDLFNEKEIKLAQLSNSNERPFFLWNLFFKEIFDEGGFDVVIANPPYVEFKNLNKEFKNQIEPLYKTLTGKYDLYIAFNELYVKILKENGISVSIHPTRFMQRDYGIELRRFLSENTKIVSIIDFVDKQIFENALAYTGIFLNKKNKIITQEFNYRRAKTNKIIKDIAELTFKLESDIFQSIDVSSSELQTNLWVFQDFNIDKIFKKITSKGILLKDCVDFISQGIATGKDSVFILSKDYIESNKIEMMFLKPFLKGKDISPYKINYKNKFLIYPYDTNGKVISENIIKNNAPNLYYYLSTQALELKGRGYFDKSNKLWFELWNQRSPEKFEQMKIITLDNAKRNSFALDENNFFGSTTIYNLIKEGAEIEFYVELILILNSKLLNYYHAKNTIPQAGGYLRYQAIFINDLPIVFGLSNELINEYLNNRTIVDNEEFLKKVDKEVYKCYELNEDEINLIESSLKIITESN